MTTRERLPDRRPAETFDLVAGGLKYVCTVGRFADGRIGELFLGNHKSNSAADTIERDGEPRATPESRAEKMNHADILAILTQARS